MRAARTALSLMTVVGALVWAAPASAGTASVEDGSRVVFTDTAAEVNALAVSETGSALVLTDSTTPVVAGAGCTQVSVNQASCPVDHGSPQANVSLDLGAGNDTADLTGEHLVTGVMAGPGNDVVQGTDTFDSLRGGGGADELHGNGGNDILADEDVSSGETGAGPDTLDGGADNDVVYYQDRAVTDSLTIDLAKRSGPAGDKLTAIESVQTGAAADTVSGDGAGNSLFGGGRDTLRGRGGNDDLETQSGGRLDGGAGNDSLTVKGNGVASTKIACGAGRDYVDSFPADVLKRDCEHANAGKAIVGIEGLRNVQPRLRRSHVLRFRVTCIRGDGCSGRLRLLRSNGSLAASARYSVTDDTSFVAFRLSRADRSRLARGHLFTFRAPKDGAPGFRMLLKV
jgi:Ca2+-binding RTX toxin-like protein